MRFGSLAGVALAVLLVAAPASLVRAQDGGAEAALRLQAGRTALAAGDKDRAELEFLRALALEPGSTEIVGELMGLDEEADRRALWAYHAIAAGADDRGKFKVPKDWPAVGKQDLALLAETMKLRARAARSVASASSKLKGAVQEPAKWWLDGLGDIVSEGAPALRKLHADAAKKNEARVLPEPGKVLRALKGLMTTAAGAGRTGVALDAARLLRGLYQQKGQKDAKTAGVGTTSEIQKVVQTIESLRAAQRRGEQKVWTVQELLDIPEYERRAWSDEHDTWDNPGIALSTTGMYRIETVCGLETLAVVADEIELHHRRLANYVGKDPFKGRLGTVRICKSYADMEGEGQPFWWAGGWQAGDLTTISARFTDNARLGALLTHELTHRFDGMVYPGLPAWLVEGRAVYTESCSPNPAALTLDERVYQPSRLWDAAGKGYADVEGLTKLLTGKVDDYRHNYDAGYALWLFLVRFRSFEADQDTAPIFAEQVPAYLASFKTHMRMDPVERFTKFFADGKDGRPGDLVKLSQILSRFWWEASQGGEEPEWRKPWTEQSRTAQNSLPWEKRRFIYDTNTSPRSRTRHDPPVYGQYHAYLAGKLFEAEGRRQDALVAYGWALAVDDLDAAQIAHLRAYFDEAGKSFVTWAMEHRLAWASPDHPRPDGAPAGPLSGAWKVAKGLADRLADLETTLREAKRDRLADALRAEHDAVAGWIGTPLLGKVTPTAHALPSTGEKRPPDCHPFHGALLGGLIEERWAPLDSEVNELWHQPNPAGLELGRGKKAKVATGQIRDANVRKVFVRGEESYGGTYTVRTRVRFRSAYAEARLVLGHTHTDRGLEVTFSGGDWSYAVGDTKEGVPLRGVNVGIDDSRSFDGEQSALHTSAWFASPRNYFDVTVHVAGPFIRVLVNGEETLTHRRLTGVPLVGRIGFGLSRGLVGFEDPVVRRHRVLGADRTCACETFDEPFSTTGANLFRWDTATGRRVIGIPKNPGGTMLLVFTQGCPYDVRIGAAVKIEAEPYRRRFLQHDLPVAVRMFFPQLAEGEVASASARWPTAKALDLPEGFTHMVPQPEGLFRLLMEQVDRFAAEEQQRNRELPDDEAHERAKEFIMGTPMWVMLDDQNVIRACAPEHSPAYMISLAHRLAGW